MADSNTIDGGDSSCHKCDVNFPCWGDREQCQRGFANPTLKPCPFCGSDKVSVSRNTWSDGREGRYVECEECEAASGSWPIGEATAERASELAARKWNRRAEIANG